MWKNKLRRLLSVILATTLLCSHWTGLTVKAENEQVVYVSASGSDENTGTTAEAPVATLAKAYELLLVLFAAANKRKRATDVVVIAVSGKLMQEPLCFKLCAVHQNNSCFSIWINIIFIVALRINFIPVHKIFCHIF